MVSSMDNMFDFDLWEECLIEEKQQEDLDKEKIRDLKIVIEYFDDIIKSNEPNRYILESRL